MSFDLLNEVVSIVRESVEAGLTTTTPEEFDHTINTLTGNDLEVLKPRNNSSSLRWRQNWYLINWPKRG